jgi:hypothetical protein
MAVQLLLSCVSDEFGIYRAPLDRELTLPDVAVKIQEAFKPQGGDTLQMLTDYIGACAAVVHFVGEMAGAAPPQSCVTALLTRHPEIKARLPPLGEAIDAGKAISFTQWEAWLALYLDKAMLIVTPAPGVARDPKFAPTAHSRVAQAEHLARLAALDRRPGIPFVNQHDLAKQVLASSVIPALKRAAFAAAEPARRPCNLPFLSLGDLFKGRDAALDELRAALAGSGGAALVARRCMGSAGSARRGSRSNTLGAISRIIRRCCSSAPTIPLRWRRISPRSRAPTHSTCR